MHIADSFTSVLGLIRPTQPLAEAEPNDLTFGAAFDLLGPIDSTQPTVEFLPGDVSEYIIDVISEEQDALSSTTGDQPVDPAQPTVIRAEVEGALGPDLAQPLQFASTASPIIGQTLPIVSHTPPIIGQQPTEAARKSPIHMPLGHQATNDIIEARALDREYISAQVHQNTKLDLGARPVPLELAPRPAMEGSDHFIAPPAQEHANGVQKEQANGMARGSAIVSRDVALPLPQATPQSLALEFLPSITNTPLVESGASIERPSIEAQPTLPRASAQASGEPSFSKEIDPISSRSDRVQATKVEVLDQIRPLVNDSARPVDRVQTNHSEAEIAGSRSVQIHRRSIDQPVAQLPLQSNEPSSQTRSDQSISLPAIENEARKPSVVSHEIERHVAQHKEAAPLQTMAPAPPPQAAAVAKDDPFPAPTFVKYAPANTPEPAERPQDTTAPIQIENNAKNTASGVGLAPLEAEPELLIGRSARPALSRLENVEKPTSSSEAHLRTAETVKDIASQIKDAAQSKERSHIEIRLNPEELGKVKISLSPQDAGGAVSIIVERPETLDLMRRHMDQLLKEFKSSGWVDVDLSVSRQDQGNHDRSGHNDGSKPRDLVMPKPGDRQDRGVELHLAESPSHVRSKTTDRLDLRI